MEVKLQEKFVSILIDLGYNSSNVSPKISDKCDLAQQLNEEPWLVQLETGTKRRISHWVKLCVVELSEMHIRAKLNVFPLGVYDKF